MVSVRNWAALVVGFVTMLVAVGHNTSAKADKTSAGKTAEQARASLSPAVCPRWMAQISKYRLSKSSTAQADIPHSTSILATLITSEGLRAMCSGSDCYCLRAYLKTVAPAFPL